MEAERELIAAIRRRPAMYIGWCDARGFVGLLRQIVRYAFHLADSESFLFKLNDPRSGRIRFAPTYAAFDEQLFTDAGAEEHKCGFFGFEFAALMALSSHFHAKLVGSDGQLLSEHKFARGYRVWGPETLGDRFPQSVDISFELDDSILSLPIGLKSNYFVEEFRTLAYLYKGKLLTLEYMVGDIPSSVVFKFDRGLSELIDVERFHGHAESLLSTRIEHQFGEFSIDLAFCFRGTPVDTPYLISFVNEERSMEHGTHVAGMVDGILSALINFQNEVGVVTDSRLTRESITKLWIAAIHLRIEKPLFEGAIRSKVINRSIAGPIANVVGENFLGKLKQSPNEAVDLIQMVARLSAPF
jgi:DNA gyrase subunit B